MLRAALRLAEVGCHIFPLKPDQKVPATAHGLHDATRDRTQIVSWWTEMPTANVGISVGPSGLAVVDVDGIFGYAAWRKLTAEHPVPDTLTVTTPNGRHHYYRAGDQPLRNTAGQLGSHVDTRGPGGYVVAPPSTVAGRPYLWGTVPAELPMLPGWIVDRLAPPVRPAQDAVQRLSRPGPTSGSRYADAALSGEVQAVLDSVQGARNCTLNGSAFNLGQLVGAGQLDERLACEALTDAGHAAGLGATEIACTVRSGMSAGMANPRRVSAA